MYSFACVDLLIGMDLWVIFYKQEKDGVSCSKFFSEVNEVYLSKFIVSEY